MTCACESGHPCSKVSNCYMDQELADKQEDIDSLRAENAALRELLQKWIKSDGSFVQTAPLIEKTIALLERP
jgi:hypothetical protein